MTQTDINDDSIQLFWFCGAFSPLPKHHTSPKFRRYSAERLFDMPRSRSPHRNNDYNREPASHSSRHSAPHDYDKHRTSRDKDRDRDTSHRKRDRSRSQDAEHKEKK